MQSASLNPSTSSRRRHCQSPSAEPPAAKRPRVVDAPVPMAVEMREPVDLTREPPVFKPMLGAKKFFVKNLRPPVKREAQKEEYCARVENEVGRALEAMLANEIPPVAFTRIYNGVENACLYGKAANIYSLLKDRIEAHLQTVVLPRITGDGTQSNIGVLRIFGSEWKIWKTQTVNVRSTLSYLDRTYLMRDSMPSINALVIKSFRRIVFPKGQALPDLPGQRVLAGICDLIEFDRQDDSRLDSALLKESIRFLYVLGVYTTQFEPVFLSKSVDSFRKSAEIWSDADLKSYISACRKLLEREKLRCVAYNLDSTTEKQLMDSAHEIFINSYAEKLLRSDSIAQLLSAQDVESMKGLYELLRVSGMHKRMKEPWFDYIQRTGEAIVADKEKGESMVVRILVLKRSSDLMIRDAFAKDDDFLRSMRECFNKFMNDRKVASCWDTGTSKIAEMTAKHIDMLLRDGLKRLPEALLSDVKDRAVAEKSGQAVTADEDAELDRQLDQALELFRFVEGKGTFEAFYKQDLARRLLLERSASRDAERSMLTKLRVECGPVFTQNLEQMFKDQETARDEMLLFRQCSDHRQEQKPSVALTVKTLTASAWPTYPDVRLNLPDEVAVEIERFGDYYKKSHTGKTLTWKHSLDFCTIQATFPRGSKELLVSAFQAVVLMTFNSEPAEGFLTYEQISTATGLQGANLDRTLQSLACGAARVITKHPKGKEVKKSDTFSYNKQFTHAKYRIKINQIQLKETKEENTATHERVARDRRFETQAAIMRIMKSRKTVGHAELVAEVIKMTKERGSVEPAAIKQQIESLVDKEYLDREDNAYTYLA